MGDCRDKALDLVGRRPHFRQELLQKLLARGYPSLEVEAALEDLERLGLLDDLEHARSMAAGSMTRKGLGPRRMLHELLRRGVGEDTAETVVAEVFADPEEELRRARRLVLRAGSGVRASRDRLARQLDRKGYSTAVILRVLESIEQDSGCGSDR